MQGLVFLPVSSFREAEDPDKDKGLVGGLKVRPVGLEVLAVGAGLEAPGQRQGPLGGACSACLARRGAAVQHAL